MDKGISLSVESEAKSYQTNFDNSVRKALLVEQHIKALENSTKNTELCKICNVELKSYAHAKTHYVSGKHLQNIQLLREKLLLLPEPQVKFNSYITEIPNSSLPKEAGFCKICRVTTLGNGSMEYHCNSEGHKTNQEAYCEICQVKTISKEELAEHKRISSLHQLKLKQNKASRHTEDGLSVPQVYVTPKVSPKKSQKVENDTQTDIQQNVGWNCNVCHKVFEAELLFANHKGAFPHVALENLNLLYKPEIVAALCSVSDDGDIICTICDVNMKNLHDVNSHLSGIKHTKRFKNAFKELFPEENVTNTEKGNKAQKKIEEKGPGNSFFYCYICKLEFSSKAEMNVHALSFPHVELAKFKSETVSLGVPYAEYWTWTQGDNYFSCTLCNAKLSNASVSRHHCKAPNHKERLTQWCNEFSTWKFGPVVDPKYFYCKTCDVPLVGTSESELHYRMKQHLRRLELFCQICNVPNSTEEMLQEHNRSLIHLENVFRKKEDPVNPQTHYGSKMDGLEIHSDKKFNKTDDTNSPRHSSDVVRNQVLAELEKLTNTLYYSKSLPYEISLEYLKKFNKEITELKKKYQKKPESPGSLEHKNSNRIIDTRKELEEETPNSLNNSLTVPKNDQSETIVKECGKNVKSGFKKRKIIQTAISVDPNTGEDILQITTGDNLNKFVAENEDLQKVSEKKNFKISEEDEVVVDYRASFEDKVRFIKHLINEMEKFPYKDNLEIRVLREIEKLIKFLHSCSIPPDVVLGFFQKWNKELDHILEENKKTNKYFNE